VVAKTRNLNAILLGSLEDGEIVIDLVRFIVDEYLYFLGGEGREGSGKLPKGSHFGQHQINQ
jgi:hypothetical protein